MGQTSEFAASSLIVRQAAGFVRLTLPEILCYLEGLMNFLPEQFKMATYLHKQVLK